MPATQSWLGGAPAVAGADTLAITTNSSSSTYTFTINGKSVSQIGLSGGAATTAAAWCAALQAALYPEFLESVFSVVSATITRIGIVAGYPQPLASEVAGGATATVAGGSGVITFGNATAPTGPNFWNNALNWSTGTVPASNDSITIANSAVPILYGLNQAAIIPALLNIDMTFTAPQGIGLPVVNSFGSSTYNEYRLQNLQIGGCPEIIGNNANITGAVGCGRINIDNGSVSPALVTVNATGTSSDATGLETLQWKGTCTFGSGNVINLNRGSMAIAGRVPGDVANVSGGINVGYITSPTSDANLRVGAGATLATVTMIGGVVSLYAGATTILKSGGSLTINAGAGGITTLVENNGTTTYLASATVGSTTIGAAGFLDLSTHQGACTFTNVLLVTPGGINDPGKTATFTNPIQLVGRVQDAGLNLGYNRKVQVS